MIVSLIAPRQFAHEQGIVAYNVGDHDIRDSATRISR